MDFSKLIGKTITQAFITKDNTKLILKSHDQTFTLYGSSDDDADSWVEDIDNDLSTILNSPILSVQEKSKKLSDKDIDQKNSAHVENYPTWYFYEISTIKGSVTLRFYSQDGTFYSAKMHLDIT